MSWTEGKGEHVVDPSLDEPRGCPTPGACSASAEIARLRAAEAAAFRRGWLAGRLASTLAIAALPPPEDKP